MSYQSHIDIACLLEILLTKPYLYYYYLIKPFPVCGHQIHSSFLIKYFPVTAHEICMSFLIQRFALGGHETF